MITVTKKGIDLEFTFFRVLEKVFKNHGVSVRRVSVTEVVKNHGVSYQINTKVLIW